MVPTRGVDDFQDALLNAAPGEVLGPMGAPGNYVVIRVDVREDQGDYPLESASGSIKAAIQLRKFELALDETIRTLRDRSEIEINEEEVAALQIRGRPAEDEGGGPHAPPPGHGGP
jgi:hypothetical protein